MSTHTWARHSVTVLSLVCSLLAAVLAGCDAMDTYGKTSKWRFLDPHSVIAPPQRTPITPILPSASPADPTEEILAGADFPKEEDYVYSAADYVIGPNDVVDIGILDLFQPGLETSVRRQVEASGYIDLPLLSERILADGFTASELKQRIADAYQQTLLRNPNISVTVAAQRQSTFSILGTVYNPGTYEITRRDMRLLDAISLARGVTDPSIRYIYVIRPKPAIKETVELDTGLIPSARPDITLPNGQPEIPALPEVPTKLPPLPEALPPAGEPAPDVPMELPPLPEIDAPSQPLPEDLLQDDPTSDLISYIGELPPPSLEVTPLAHQACQWQYVNGKWLFQEDIGRLAETSDSRDNRSGVLSGQDGQADLEDPWRWQEATKSDMARVIAINLEKLLDGDPRMNIVIRDNDIIRVPSTKIGEFYVMGEVVRPGVYSLTGRRITIKMAVAAAGNLSPVAWPENSLLVRRIGENQEQIIPINIEKIFRGEESDIFLKPNDVIAVGTNFTAPFMAVIRNAFRMTYGFGFIYDRNFADPIPRGVDSHRFTRW